MKQLVFDSGALIALERRQARMWKLVQRVVQERQKIHAPAGVLAQVWRNAPAQHDLARLLKTEALVIEPMTQHCALQVGLLLAATKTSDVVDAHVVLLGRKLQATVFTSDPGDLTRLDQSLELVTV